MWTIGASRYASYANVLGTLLEATVDPGNDYIHADAGNLNLGESATFEVAGDKNLGLYIGAAPVDKDLSQNVGIHEDANVWLLRCACGSLYYGGGNKQRGRGRELKKGSRVSVSYDPPDEPLDWVQSAVYGTLRFRQGQALLHEQVGVPGPIKLVASLAWKCNALRLVPGEAMAMPVAEEVEGGAATAESSDGMAAVAGVVGPPAAGVDGGGGGSGSSSDDNDI